MADYAIGDLQGCYTPLQRLLDEIKFDDRSDSLWFVGDLVNRGPESLAVLRFIKELPVKPRITLGNHDLHLLARLFLENPWSHKDDTLDDILAAPDAQAFGQWLRNQPLLVQDTELNVVMSHAGIAPLWTLNHAKALASELELVLQGDSFCDFLEHMYGNKPNHWSEDLQGFARLRLICNYFTRMRLCDASGALEFTYQGTPDTIPDKFYPWYATPNRYDIEADIIFGHWAALQGQCPNRKIHAIDTGCVWGGALTALRLQDMRRFSVPGQSVLR